MEHELVNHYNSTKLIGTLGHKREWFPCRLTMVPVREDSEVVIFYPDLWFIEWLCGYKCWFFWWFLYVLDHYSSPSGFFRPGASSAFSGKTPGCQATIQGFLRLVELEKKSHRHPDLSQGICWLVVWNMSISIVNFIIPIDFDIFWGVGIPPTSLPFNVLVAQLSLKLPVLGLGRPRARSSPAVNRKPTQGQRLTRWAQKQGWSLRVLEWDVKGFMG